MGAGEVGLNRLNTEDSVAALDSLFITDYELLTQAFHTLHNGACAFLASGQLPKSPGPACLKFERRGPARAGR